MSNLRTDCSKGDYTKNSRQVYELEKEIQQDKKCMNWGVVWGDRNIWNALPSLAISLNHIDRPYSCWFSNLLWNLEPWSQCKIYVWHEISVTGQNLSELSLPQVRALGTHPKNCEIILLTNKFVTPYTKIPMEQHVFLPFKTLICSLFFHFKLYY